MRARIIIEGHQFSHDFEIEVIQFTQSVERYVNNQYLQVPAVIGQVVESGRIEVINLVQYMYKVKMEYII